VVNPGCFWINWKIVDFPMLFGICNPELSELRICNPLLPAALFSLGLKADYKSAAPLFRITDPEEQS
jgi:hypothetical protein